MDVPQTRTEVTTSGFYRDELEALKEALLRCDLAYSGDLTSRTRVLVVHDTCASKKFEVAREQQIPCVSSSWVYDGQCSLNRAEEFDVCTTLCHWAAHDECNEICTTGVDSTLRAVVREIATFRGVRFNSILSRRSCLLIVPSLSSTDSKAPRNDKIEFAKRHSIPMVTIREFVLRYGRPGDVQRLLERRSQSHGLRSAPASTVIHLTRSSLDATQSCQQLRADMADVVVCALSTTGEATVKEEGALSEARTLAALCGATWREQVSDDTTHVLVLTEQDGRAGDTASSVPLTLTTCSVFPRPGLETVRVDWLRACLRDQRRHACVNFRIRLAYKPVVMITGISVEKRDSFHCFLEKCGLYCDVQDRLVLRRDPPGSHSQASLNTMPPLTTHLIVPRSALITSADVEQLARERHCGNGATQCTLVDLEWLLRSIRARKWIEPAFFELTVPPPSVVIQERVKQRRTENGGGVVQPLGGSQLPSPVADTADGAADAGSGEGTISVEEEEGASQTAPSQNCVMAPPLPVNATSPVKVDELPHSLTLEALLEVLESHAVPFDVPRSPPPTQMVAASQTSCTERATAAGSVSAMCRASAAPCTSSKPSNDAPTLPRATQTLPLEQCGYESQTVVYDHDNVSVAPREFRPGGSSYVRPSITLGDLTRLGTSALPSFGDSVPKNSHESQRGPWQPSQSSCTHFVLLLSKEVMKEVNCARFQELFPWVQCTQSVSESTHLVTDKPAKTEAFLCALAAGKWIVSSAFLAESMRAGRILNEQGYEWNAARATSAGHRASVAELVQGCRMQRLSAQRPFATWHVLLSCSSAARTVSFAHVLKCGGCADVQAKSPEEILQISAVTQQSSAVHSESIVLADDDVWTLPQLERFSQADHLKHPHVLRLDYLVHCLFSVTPSTAHFELLRALRSKARATAT